MQCWVAVSTEAFARELIGAPADEGVGADAASSKPSGVPASARLPPATPALLGAAADALWPPLRALLAKAHGCAPAASFGCMKCRLVVTQVPRRSWKSCSDIFGAAAKKPDVEPVLGEPELTSAAADVQWPTLRALLAKALGCAHVGYPDCLC